MFNYLNEVRAEMRHVSWPSRRQAITYTVVVVIVALSTAVYLGLLDYLFTTLLQRVL
jgi:preprotein translocase subunit SecE